MGVHIELCLLRLVVQTILLHSHLSVAKQILLLCEFCLGVEDLQVEA